MEPTETKRKRAMEPTETKRKRAMEPTETKRRKFHREQVYVLRKTSLPVQVREKDGGILAFLEEMSQVEGIAGLRFWCGRAMLMGRIHTGILVVIFEAPPRGIKFIWDDSILVDRMRPIWHRLGAIDRAYACDACQERGHHAGNCAEVVPVVSPDPIDFLLTEKPAFT